MPVNERAIWSDTVTIAHGELRHLGHYISRWPEDGCSGWRVECDQHDFDVRQHDRVSLEMPPTCLHCVAALCARRCRWSYAFVNG